MFDSFQYSMNPTKLAIVKTGNSKSTKNPIINITFLPKCHRHQSKLTTLLRQFQPHYQPKTSICKTKNLCRRTFFYNSCTTHRHTTAFWRKHEEKMNSRHLSTVHVVTTIEKIYNELFFLLLLLL